MSIPAARPDRPPVPVRTILASIGLVLATVAGLYLLRALHQIIAWLVIAVFFAVLLNPAVDFLQRRLHVRRVLATFLVFVTGVLVFAGLLYIFIKPIVDQVNHFIDNLPGYIDDAENGRGSIGRLVERYNIEDYVERNRDRWQSALTNAGKPALDVARTVASTVAALLTILVLAFLMLLEGPQMLQTGLNVLPPGRRERVRRVASDCAKAITGYMAGNLLISLIAGIAAYVALLVLGVPFREVLALWVAFADLIPLVGATLGAVPAVAVAFLHSTPAGIGTLLFFIAYQQLENHVLQVTIMAKTVALNPLVVLVSVLVGVDLFGILGALLAIPAAGVIQVIARDLWDNRRGRLKPEPTVGEDEVPVSEAKEAS